MGVMGGILLEGSKLARAIFQGIVFSGDPKLTIVVTLSSLAIMIILTYRKLPISLTQVTVGAAVGAALAGGIRVNWFFTSLVALS